MYDTTVNPVSQLLDGTVASLDIPEDLFRAAATEYADVGDWLADHADTNGEGWEVHPQGSFLLGTVVQPLGRDEYDVDLVCRRNIEKQSTTQAGLKAGVGTALHAYVVAREGESGAPDACDERKRCWTLTYERAFHLDVLPAIPNLDDPPTGILLTDRELRAWQYSNPKAYAEWFQTRMAEEFRTERHRLAEAARTDPEEIPESAVKTTLQRVVQALKRHRDLHFANELEKRPASILITTLAAHAYRGEQELYDALLQTVALMPDFIDHDGEHWTVLNPVQERENFADKWATEPELAERFYVWLRQLDRDLREADELRGLPKIAARLSESFGRDSVEWAAQNLGEGYRSEREGGRLGFASASGILSSVGQTRVKEHDFYGKRSG